MQLLNISVKDRMVFMYNNMIPALKASHWVY